MLALSRFFPELNFGAIRSRLELMHAVHRERAALRDLPPRILEDVGLTARDVYAEAARPVWDVDHR